MSSGASQAPRVVESRQLLKLQTAVGLEGYQTQLLRLGALCLGVPVKYAVESRSFNTLKESLDDHVTRREGEGLALLLALADAIGMPTRECEELKNLCCQDYDTIITDWEKRKEYRFAKLIVKICTKYSKDEFRTLRGHCLSYLTVKIPEQSVPDFFMLFRKLFDQRIVTSDNVNSLRDMVMDKVDLQQEIDKYKHSIGQFSQPSGEGSIIIIPYDVTVTHY